MKGFLITIIGVIITGIVVLLCLSSCILASKSDEYWQEVIQELEKRNKWKK